MQTTLLPVDICNKLDKKVRDFVWGSEEGERKMLMTKYFDRTSEGLRPRKSKRWSSCWKGLQETWPTFQGGLYWGIRNGRKTNFWTERWLDNGSILSEQCTPPSDRIVDKVADYCTTDGNWDLELLSSFLPNTLMEEVVGMTPPCDELEDDIPVWGLEPNGCYSVRSGYLLSIGLEDYNGMSIWKRIWRWEGPQRVRQFLWLAVNDRLLTNAERHRRHLATSTDCNLCHEVSEDVTHILRDCPPAKNERIFERSNISQKAIVERCKYWSNLSSSAFASANALRTQINTQRREASIHWEGAPEPFATINTDGSVDQRTGRAAAGGSIRNCQGRIVEAFALNLGKCSITRAELAGVIEGMERAWQGGFRHIEVQIDSLCAVKLLSQTDGLNHQHAGIVGKFRALIKRNWVVRNQAYL
ncbi:Putative ribonuclease H protein At1g65750 [Linum perenne]